VQCGYRCTHRCIFFVLVGGGYVLRTHLWNAFRDTSKCLLRFLSTQSIKCELHSRFLSFVLHDSVEAWTGHRVVECSLYGVRVYKENSILATHVDRLPLVSSAIINVDQDVDEDWPLEVIGHDGKATNVTMQPGKCSVPIFCL
jgi:hypothetical protein